MSFVVWVMCLVPLLASACGCEVQPEMTVQAASKLAQDDAVIVPSTE